VGCKRTNYIQSDLGDENMKITTFLILSIACIMICVCSAGCLGLIFPDNTPKTVVKYDNVIPTVQPVAKLPEMTKVEIAPVVYKPVTPVPVTPSPTLIISKGNSGWMPYINYNDGIKVYKPSDWKVTTIKSSTLNYELPSGKILEDVIYIRNPSDTGFIMIYGMDFNDTISGAFMQNSEISNDYYQALIDGLVAGDADAISTATNIQRDENFYLINGVPARKVSFDLTYKGYSEKLHSDAFLYMRDGKAYMSWYVSIRKSSAGDLETAGIIMRSFTMI
jgi:hypothetical protein